MKHIIVKNCRECPFGWADYYRGGFMQARCEHKVYHKQYDYERHYKELEEEEYEGLAPPSHCPLEDMNSSSEVNE